MQRLPWNVFSFLAVFFLLGFSPACAVDLPDLALTSTPRERTEIISRTPHSFGIGVPEGDSIQNESVTLEVLEGVTANPKLRRAGSVDFSSLQSIVDSVVKLGMTDEQKALALWRFAMNCCYIGKWGTSLDGLEHVNVYGYGYCGTFAAVLEPLWWAAGFKARHLNIGNHAATEVFYDNDWHYIDANTRAYYLEKDNRTIASLEDLNRDTSLWNMTRKGSSHKGGKKDYYMTMHPNGQGRSPAYSADFAMAKGDVLILDWRKSGKWCPVRGEEGGPDPAPEPPIYANGRFIFRRDFTNPEQSRTGLVGSENIDWRDTSSGYLHPATVRKEARLIYQVRTSYFMPETMVSGRFFRRQKGDQVDIDLSIDNGKTWTSLWRAAEIGQVSASVATSQTSRITTDSPWKYSYLLRVRMKASGAPRDVGAYFLESSTVLFYNPLSLPALHAGNNLISFADSSTTGRIVKVTYTWKEGLPINISKENPLEGETVTLNARVSNHGVKGASKVPVAFFHGEPGKGGVEIGRTLIGHIPAGSSAVASTQWKATRKGPDKNGRTIGAVLYAVIDPDNQIREADKSKNVASRTFRVLNPPDVRIPDASFIRLEKGNTPENLTVLATVRNFSNTPNYGFYLEDHGTAEDILIRIFDGDPKKGGTLLAEQLVDRLLPLEHRTVAAKWNVSGLKGMHGIYVQVHQPKNLTTALGSKSPSVTFMTVDLDRYRSCGGF